MGAYENQLQTTVLKIHVDDSPTMLSAGTGIRYTPPHFQPLTILFGYDWYGFDVDQSLIEESLDQSLSHVKLGAQYNF